MATFDQTEILWNKYKNLPTAFPTQTFLANQAVGDAFPTIIPTTLYSFSNKNSAR